ncbi:hypothetical protein Pst134EA_009128 [Puccinia striiformis f. sp. tritici]|uniref:hypothetical protein n=1 Tax=Puccinia striiformis f. sp. tritici TaxID=168172 RepID=UPI002008BD4F|nr:hypothetical protein Pst134EA_009128 [Puccinia striiformis f. sp. tritici]KAH9468593.1 hypothetical protein Pst134EA_009128 [Puccinia striiformis f. sp. tritici]
MKATTVAILLAISFQAVLATIHTTCYNYFLEKDGCVFSAADARNRCPAPIKDHDDPVKQFNCINPKVVKRSERHSLGRRYDDNDGSFAVAGGKGICGTYNSTTDLGVCLWSGAEQKSPTVESAGWLNGLKTSNCGKQVYVQRKGQPKTVKYVKVLDGCSFDTTALSTGCFQIALTSKLFDEFNPTAKEKKDGLILDGISWDFNNLLGQNLQSGPV